NQLVIDGSGSNVVFAGNVSDTGGISASAHSITVNSGVTLTGGAISLQATASGGQDLTGSTASSQSISATGLDASVTGNGTLSGSTIDLEAHSSATAIISSGSSVEQASITTGNSATITISGHVQATGALTVLTDVTLNDTVNLTSAGSLQSVTIDATNTSTI